jgi:hypothetical protein
MPKPVFAAARVILSDADLEALMVSLSSRSLVIDLTRRGLTPFFAADQIAAQTRQTVASFLDDLPPVLLPTDGRLGAEHIGSWIDFELFGDPACILADRLATDLGARDVDHLAVLLPPSVDDLTRADGLVVAAVARIAQRVTLSYPGTGYALPTDLGLSTEPPLGPAPINDPALPPGCLSPALRTKLGILGYPVPPGIATSNGTTWLAPCHRAAAEPSVPPALADMAAGWGWKGQFYRLLTASADTLAQDAWRALAAHDADLAGHLAERAVACDDQSDFARTALATIRIIAQDYDALTQSEAPTHTDRLNRAWGAALSGDPVQAKAEFSNAQHAGGADAISLYLRNISALAHLRTGDIAGAWRLQHQIRDALATLDRPSPHLVFINSLNMARLARHQGDRAAARDHLAAAFAARDPEQSEHDRLYHAVLSASVAEAPDVRRQWQDARAVFAQQAHPGAIPLRSFRSITGRAPRRFERRDVAVAEALDRLVAQQEILK